MLNPEKNRAIKKLVYHRLNFRHGLQKPIGKLVPPFVATQTHGKPRNFLSLLELRSRVRKPNMKTLEDFLILSSEITCPAKIFILEIF